MSNTSDEIAKLKRLRNEIENCGQNCPYLHVGDTVVLRDGSYQLITSVKWGEATGLNAFYRWSQEFPYNIEHNAMDFGHEIVDVISSEQ